MISAVCTLFAVVILLANPGPGWANSAVETPDETPLPAESQCKSPDLAFDQITPNKLSLEATNRVYCQFRIFCPAEHRCCNVGPTFWCCPLPSTCDADMDADDWTGCHGAHGVNPL